MIYAEDDNPFDMDLLTDISEYFNEVRKKYREYEGSMRGVDVNMLTNQVPGGMLSILEKQLLDLNKSDKLKLLIEEIPRIRKDVGFVPLVTPSSQIVGAQALMNVLDEKRYQTLNKEFIDMVNGYYGKIPGDICPKLRKKVDKVSDGIKENTNIENVDFYKNEFKSFCDENNLKKLYSSETDLLNFILFPKEAKDFYLLKNKSSMNDIIGLQEGFGLYVE